MAQQLRAVGHLIMQVHNLYQKIMQNLVTA